MVLFAACGVLILFPAIGIGTEFFAGPWLTALAYVVPLSATAGLVAMSVRSRDDRLAWALVALGFGLWSLGGIGRFTVWFGDASRPVPTWVDPLFLAMYPLVFLGLLTTIWDRLRNFRYAAWLDGIAGALVLAAVAFAFAFERIESLTGHDELASVVLLAYPLGDFILLGAIAFVLMFNGRQADGSWPVVGAGLLLFLFADVIFSLVAMGDVETSLYGVWYVGLVLVLIGSWRDNADVRERSALGAEQLLLPAALILIALVVLDAADPDHRLKWVAISLATLAVILVIGRLLLTGRESVRILSGRQFMVTDELTGLPSRTVIDGWLAEIDPSTFSDERSRTQPLALLVIEIEHFSSISAALGLRAGDQILSASATRLKRAIARPRRLGRLGEDRFILIMRRASGDASANQVGADIVEAFEAPFWIDGLRVYLRPVIGIALAPQHAETGPGLLNLARRAADDVHEAREPVSMYSGEDVATRETIRLTADLRTGIGNGELVLFFQPMVEPRERVVTALEALVRWRHPERGLLGPHQFIAMAERNGLMHAMTAEIVSKAIKQVGDWERQHDLRFCVSVNLAMPNLLDSALPEMVASELDRHGIERRRLTLEITENLLMVDPERVQDNLVAFRNRGMPISLDDFGAGTTSLSHLRDLPLDQVKLDRKLVAPVRDSRDNEAIIAGTVGIAHKLGLGVVAEGAENQETVDELIRLSCNEIQGYFFAKPMPGDAVPRWIAQFDGQPVTI